MKTSVFTRLVWYLLIAALPFTDILIFPATLKNAGEPSTFLILITWFAILFDSSLSGRLRVKLDGNLLVLLLFFSVSLLSIVMCYWVPVRQSLGEAVWEKSVRQLAHFL